MPYCKRLLLLSLSLCLPLLSSAETTGTPPLVEVPTSATGAIAPVLHAPVTTGVVPWTNLKLNNDPRNFQFAIVSDRTGAARPGIFEDAVGKLNLLQPEFVMSVGDLIQGYTNNRKQLDGMWEEFLEFTSRLTMPFFYVPGNHDVSNPMQRDEWVKRFGRLYYHFTYGDVLFLCLCSDEEAAGMSQTQVDYFRKVLEENPNPRWTVAFLHRPLWIGTEVPTAGWKKEDSSPGEQETAQVSNRRWLEFESLLHGRKHTVYAGHLHDYTKYVRNDSNYYVLASTGGGSAMRGAFPYGEFDHFAWITMTDDGPIMANLELKGILPENLRTDKVTRLVHSLQRSAVSIPPVVVDPLPFSSATLTARLQNNDDLPLKLVLKAPEGIVRFTPKTMEVVVPPNNVSFVNFQVDASQVSNESQLAGLAFSWKATYTPEEEAEISIDSSTRIWLDPARLSLPADQATSIAIDGQSGDWADRWKNAPAKFPIVAGKAPYAGEKDAALSLASAYDNQFVYLAVTVHDNKVVGNGPPKDRDSFALWIDPRGPDGGDTSHSTHRRALKINKEPRRGPDDKDPDWAIRLRVEAADHGTSSMLEVKGVDGAIGASSTTGNSIFAEFAIPVEVFSNTASEPWESFRVNLRYADEDARGEPGNSGLWWRPDWVIPSDYPGSGLIKRQ